MHDAGAHIDPISAIVVLIKRRDNHEMSDIQICPALPPATRAMLIVKRVLSHEDMRIMENPSIEIRRKFR